MPTYVCMYMYIFMYVILPIVINLTIIHTYVRRYVCMYMYMFMYVILPLINVEPQCVHRYICALGITACGPVVVLYAGCTIDTLRTT